MYRIALFAAVLFDITTLASWLVTDVPTCPQSVHASDVSAERCRLNWKAPRDDGGSEIIGEIRLLLPDDWLYILLDSRQ